MMTQFRIPRARFAADRDTGPGDERIEDRCAAARRRAQRLPSVIPGAQLPRARRSDAQREARRPGACGRGVPGVMRFIIMHKTNAHWEAGGVPGPELIARVGDHDRRHGEGRGAPGREGLRAQLGRRAPDASPLARARHHRPVSGRATSCPPASASCDAGRSTKRSTGRPNWPRRWGRQTGVEIDIRPVTEPWDIGMAAEARVLTTHRYMVLRKATPATEAGVGAVARAATRAGRVDRGRDPGRHPPGHRETMRPSGRGRRHNNSRNGVGMFDGPFAETKELLGRLRHRLRRLAGRGQPVGRALHRRGRDRRSGRPRTRVRPRITDLKPRITRMSRICSQPRIRVLREILLV